MDLEIASYVQFKFKFILFVSEFYTIQRLNIFGLGESVFHKDHSAKSFTKLAFIDKSYDGLKF